MKLVILLGSFVLLLVGCHRHRHHNTSISISENGEILRLNASFNPDRTYRLQRYLDRRLGDASNMSFEHATIDATITLDDETSFYMESHPGHLSIKFNRQQNTEEAYEKMRSVFEGIKKVVY